MKPLKCQEICQPVFSQNRHDFIDLKPLKTAMGFLCRDITSY